MKFARAILFNSIAESTRAGYRSAVNHIAKFCAQHKLKLSFPITADTLCLWLAASADKLTYSSLRVYLHGIATTHVELGHASPLQASPLIWRMYKAIKRLQGHRVTRVRLPITTAVLMQLERWQELHSLEGLALRAAMWLGTCGLLRSGEFAVRDKHSSVLRRKDLQFMDAEGTEIINPADWESKAAYMQVHIARSKTDPFSKGVNIVVSNSKAVMVMIAYLVRAKRAAGNPLFMRADGIALDVSTLVRYTQALISKAGIADAARYTGHSFRRGGATTLHEAGISDSMIKAMGRWKSFTFATYIVTSIKALIDAGIAMTASMGKGKGVTFTSAQYKPWDEDSIWE